MSNIQDIIKLQPYHDFEFYEIDEYLNEVFYSNIDPIKFVFKNNEELELINVINNKHSYEINQNKEKLLKLYYSCLLIDTTSISLDQENYFYLKNIENEMKNNEVNFKNIAQNLYYYISEDTNTIKSFDKLLFRHISNLNTETMHNDYVKIRAYAFMLYFSKKYIDDKIEDWRVDLIETEFITFTLENTIGSIFGKIISLNIFHLFGIGLTISYFVTAIKRSKGKKDYTYENYLSLIES